MSTSKADILQHEKAGDRLEGIEIALRGMRDSQAAHRLWSGLRAADKPSLSAAVDFGLNELTAFRQVLTAAG